MEQTIIAALSQFTPYSVFVYGSRGRGDHTATSDYEVGVIFTDDQYVQRSVIHAAMQLDDVRVYPFKLSDIQTGNLETPFVASIYMHDLAASARTIQGEPVIEHLQPGAITTVDLVRDIRFYMGRALNALLSYRSGDMPTALDAYSKSCLFGLRALGVLRQHQFVTGYDNIYALRTALVSDKTHLGVIETAHDVRQGATTIPADAIFDNLSFLDAIEQEILAALETDGNQDCLGASL